MSNAVVGKTFVFSGSLPSIPREEAEKRVLALGGIISCSVTKQTDYLIAGNSPGSKYFYAKTLGTTILEEEQFVDLLDSNDEFECKECKLVKAASLYEFYSKRSGMGRRPVCILCNRERELKKAQEHLTEQKELEGFIDFPPPPVIKFVEVVRTVVVDPPLTWASVCNQIKQLLRKWWHG